MARGALVADFQVAGVAIPVVAGFIQVRILGQDDLLAMCPDLLEAPLALPVVAGGGEIAMLRHRHRDAAVVDPRSEEHTSELQSLMRISYAVFCLKKKSINTTYTLFTLLLISCNMSDTT